MKSLIFALLIALVPNSAWAKKCGEGYYKDKVLGCVPKGRTFVKELDPRTQADRVKALGKAITSGNSQDVERALGGILTGGSFCGACKTYAANIFPDIPQENIDQIVGRGAMVWAATGYPEFIVIDIVKNTASAAPLAPEEDETLLSPSKRAPKSFVATADCLGKTDKGELYAAWSSNPILKSGPTSFTFPTVDLAVGDLIELTAPICPAFMDKSRGRSIDTASMQFERSKAIPGSEKSLKWFLIGKSASRSLQPAAISPQIHALPVANESVTESSQAPSENGKYLWAFVSAGIIAVGLVGFVALRRQR